MFQSIWDDVKREFQYGNMVTRIILVNIAIWIIVNLAKIFMHIPTSNTVLYDDFLRFFSMSPNFKFVLTHPWVPFTSIFLHEGFGHILWNMLTFYWFGRIVGDLLGNHRVLPLYILGGLVGGAFYFVAAQFHLLGLGLPSEMVLGASAAVMAMVACAAYIAPDYIFNLLLIGPVKLKYIAFVLFFLDLISIADGSNTGGHLAHLGGAAFGLFYAAQLREGMDIGKPVNQFLDFFMGLFNSRPKPKFTHQKGGRQQAYTEQKKRTQTQQTTSSSNQTKKEGNISDEQARLDAILDKIKQKGYESLSQEEKEFLFKASQK
ncbi:MAG: rhomboid family intramembrane serine protease [Saprospiraceae bacterium]|nr:rhomboid family intramembrane serine protease [Saprospiraceae bacterium]